MRNGEELNPPHNGLTDKHQVHHALLVFFWEEWEEFRVEEERDSTIIAFTQIYIRSNNLITNCELKVISATTIINSEKTSLKNEKNLKATQKLLNPTRDLSTASGDYDCDSEFSFPTSRSSLKTNTGKNTKMRKRKETKRRGKTIRYSAKETCHRDSNIK
ncbi:hypothetical protein CDAR_380751 [Caerostris darwini]|uniref:Uncharacterized protein n=1 Tax=Caerostris darwini TaxID=1538125 RepID=A0AAV4QM40_9ARAC|nr:hypothetical protein CDAR_380751 [Caerostris darwini]